MHACRGGSWHYCQLVRCHRTRISSKDGQTEYAAISESLTVQVSRRIGSAGPQDHLGCCDSAAIPCQYCNCQAGRIRRPLVSADERSCSAFLYNGRGRQESPYLAYAGKGFRGWRAHIKAFFVSCKHRGAEGELRVSLGPCHNPRPCCKVPKANAKCIFARVGIFGLAYG